LQFSLLSGLFDPLLDLADQVQVLIELALIARTDFAPNTTRLAQDSVEDAAITAFRAVGEQPVKGQGRIQFERNRRGRRTPGNM